jgi:UDP-N-acetylglucosamine 1-carboxyvinyltransferase
MDKIRIIGGAPLNGRIAVSGAKNAALGLMPAALLTDKPLRLVNMPRVADIQSMKGLLAQMGVSVSEGGEGTSHWVELNAADLTSTVAPYELVRKMRASIFVLAPLVARAGQAEVSLPGGCAIGTRPVDLYISGLTQLGADIQLDGGYIKARSKGRLKGAKIVFPFVSVGATESMMMAASLAEGETQLVNAAREPEIIDLAECLTRMGAKIEGIGTDTITIQGVDKLSGAMHSIIPDRIEAGTYAMAAAITGGKLELIGARSHHLAAASRVLQQAGVTLEDTAEGLTVSRKSDLIGVDAMTEPFPGFATDLQAQFMALMTVAKGASMITETIFENRFMHVPELARMGANITVHGSSALVRGVNHLKGAPVMATDLRASVSLVLAGLVAEGETIVHRIYHLDRGYERLEEKLRVCGATIERVREAETA